MRFRAGLYFHLSMANILPSSVVADISGKLGDQIYSRNRGGLYVKNYAVPSNPDTTDQHYMRLQLAAVPTAWASLSESDRIAWDNLAKQFPSKNKLGQPIAPSGYRLFTSRYIRTRFNHSSGRPYPIVEQPPPLWSSRIAHFIPTQLTFYPQVPGNPSGITLVIYTTSQQGAGVRSFNTLSLTRLTDKSSPFSSNYSLYSSYTSAYGAWDNSTGISTFWKFAYHFTDSGQPIMSQLYKQTNS